jgi:hypothetical protein
VALEQRGRTRLESRSLAIRLHLHEGGAERLPLGVMRITNLTRAPIYPLLDRIALQRPGEEPRSVSLACDREVAPPGRPAPREVHWCGEVANPRHSIDLPVALPEIPAEGSALYFDLLLPIIFDTGDPLTVRWGNLVDREAWLLRPSPQPDAPAPTEGIE